MGTLTRHFRGIRTHFVGICFTEILMLNVNIDEVSVYHFPKPAVVSTTCEAVFPFHCKQKTLSYFNN